MSDSNDVGKIGWIDMTTDDAPKIRGSGWICSGTLSTVVFCQGF
jgi:hypothetical protein